MASVHPRQQQADDVSTDDPEHAEVEKSGLPHLSRLFLVELARPRRPAELVVPVAPPVADDEDGQAEVGEDHPEKVLIRAGPRESWIPRDCGPGWKASAEPLCGTATGIEGAVDADLPHSAGPRR